MKFNIVDVAFIFVSFILHDLYSLRHKKYAQ